MSRQLKKIYQAELIRVGVPLLKAEQAAQNITAEQLRLIGEIWEDWATILGNHDTNTLSLVSSAEQTDS